MAASLEPQGKPMTHGTVVQPEAVQSRPWDESSVSSRVMSPLSITHIDEQTPKNTKIV